ncbi:MAG: protein TolR [Candidatus Tectomicrobia bacterium]|nr:protein TolR [Candidatus Tectomicrobia bacterium]
MAIGTGKGDRGAISEINVTPLVDVMLVLLIIFMVTAPLLEHGLDVELPRASGKELDTHKAEDVIVTVNKGGGIFINKNRFELAELREKLQAIYSSRTNKEIFLRADKDVPYGEVVKVMAEIKNAGIEKLGMITRPEEIR